MTLSVLIYLCRVSTYICTETAKGRENDINTAKTGGVHYIDVAKKAKLDT